MIMTLFGFAVDHELKDSRPQGHMAKDLMPKGQKVLSKCLQNKVISAAKRDKVKELLGVNEGEKPHQDGVAYSQKFVQNSSFSVPHESSINYSYGTYPFGGGMWFPVYPVEYQNQQPAFCNTYENQFYPYGDQQIPVDNQFQYTTATVNMLPEAYTCSTQLQEFQYFVVIDFEATCDKERPPFPQEIIEFPSVLVEGASGRAVSFFRRYIRPSYHQKLTDFCKELTGIQQSEVDEGVSLSDALLMHDKWLEDNGVKRHNFAIVTWSDWDCKVMLESECRFKNIRKPHYFNRWINLKVPFQEAYGIRCNLKGALERAGLIWEGRAHCGLDDAKNTAQLVTLLMSKGLRLSITDTLSWQDDHDNDVITDTTLPYYHYSSPTQPAQALCQSYPLLNTMGTSPPTYSVGEVRSSPGIMDESGQMQVRYFVGSGNWSAAKVTP